jgi:hypothetical protein
MSRQTTEQLPSVDLSDLIEPRDRSIVIDMSSTNDLDVGRAVMRLAYERPDWLPVLRAACAQANKCEPFGGEFAGSWVLRELASDTGQSEWRPGLRLLVGYGLIEKSGDSTRGGRRSYYRMSQRLEVERALARLDGQPNAAAARP